MTAQHPVAQISPLQPPRPPVVAARPSAAQGPARSPWHLRLSWLLVLLGGLLAYVATFVIMLVTGNPIMLPTVLLVGAATIPVTVLLLAQSTRSGPLVPARIVLVTAAAGSGRWTRRSCCAACWSRPGTWPGPGPSARRSGS